MFDRKLGHLLAKLHNRCESGQKMISLNIKHVPAGDGEGGGFPDSKRLHFGLLANGKRLKRKCMDSLVKARAENQSSIMDDEGATPSVTTCTSYKYNPSVV